VFTLEHPCFEDGNRSWQEHGCVQVHEYLREYQRPGPHGIDFHRPLADYLNEIIRLGCTLAEVVEPAVPPGQETLTGPAAIHVPNFISIAARAAS
jgi:hypothetical protein